MRTEPVQGAVLHVARHDTDTLAVFHDQIERKVLNEEVCVVPEGLAVERVEEGVAGTVGRSSATVCLTALAELEGLTTERTLVDLALLGSREGDTEVLELWSMSIRTAHQAMYLYLDFRTSMTV